MASIIVLIVANPEETGLTSAFAGTTGVARGTVVGSTGKPLNGITVIITRFMTLDDALNYRTSVARGSETTKSNERGFYAFVSLIPGYYVVTATASGEYLYCHPRLAISADMVTTVDLHMSETRLLVHCLFPRLIKPLVSI